MPFICTIWQSWSMLTIMLNTHGTIVSQLLFIDQNRNPHICRNRTRTWYYIDVFHSNASSRFDPSNILGNIWFCRYSKNGGLSSGLKIHQTFRAHSDPFPSPFPLLSLSEWGENWTALYRWAPVALPACFCEARPKGKKWLTRFCYCREGGKVDNLN